MRPVLRSAIVTLIGICLFIASAWAAPATRIARQIDSRSMTRLRGNVPPLARAEFDQGALGPSRMMQRMMITFTRTPEQETAVQKLLAEQQDPKSSFYHQWLAPEEVGERFGMSDEDLGKVKEWLAAQGFTVDEVAKAKNFILFSGSAAQVNAAFKTELHQYAVNGQLHVANATSPSVPTAMVGVISSIRGLNNFGPHARTRRVKPDFTSSVSGSHFLAPDDFATIYNLKALYNSGIDGSGQKIVIIGQTNILMSDITTFRSVSNLPSNPPQVIFTGANPGIQDQAGDLQEADLDIEWSGAVAPKATIVYISGPQFGVFDALYYAIDHNSAPVISTSYGLCESSEVQGGIIDADEAELENAAMQGQTVIGPTGDAGAADCEDAGAQAASQGYAIDFPASSPVVTAVGGTAFNENGGTYWNATNDTSQGSALFYIPEVVWNDTTASIAAGQGLSATGGGASVHFAKPAWQTGANVPSDAVRDVPDIAFNAAVFHDPFITCSNGSCQVCVTTDANCPSATSPGYRAADQTLDVVGGTSAGVPTFAGVVALINQKTGSTQGTLNPRLYQLAAGASGAYIFHDITSGDNQVPCVSGSTDCPAGTSSIGYSAGVGYDLTTGLGSVDAYNLVSNWSGTAPAADFGLSFFNPSVTLAHGGSASVGVTVQKQNGFSGTVTFTCSSSISGVTCSANPTSLTPDGTTTVTITASTSAALHAPASPRSPFAPWESVFGVAALFGMGSRKKLTKGQMVVMALLLAALIVGIASCGGGGSTTTTTGGSTGGGTTGTSTGTVTLTATSGSLSHTAQVSVTVN